MRIAVFSKIAKLFHMGNRVAFSTDLEQRLVELLSLNGKYSIDTHTWIYIPVCVIQSTLSKSDNSRTNFCCPV